MFLRNRYLLVSDAVVLLASAALAYTVRFAGWSWLSNGQWAAFVAYLLLAGPARLAVNLWLGLYARYWNLASVSELELIAASGVVGGLVSVVLGLFGVTGLGLAPVRPPLIVLVLDACLVAVGVALPRVALRLWQRREWRRAARTMDYRQLPAALIFGAGQAGQIAARELVARPGVGFRPIGFLDDDLRKRRMSIEDLPVLGTTHDAAKVALSTGAKFAVIAVPSASGDAIRQLMQLASDAGLETRIVPSLHEQIAREQGATPVRPVRIEDLLQREPIVTDTAAVRARVAGKVVLVTGAGGSIGGELCRQLAAMHPAELVLVGRGENSIFEIQQELLRTFPFVQLTPVILDVRDAERLREVMLERKPVAVFHAAAHKHVPLMEANVLEALRNNVLGTKSVVDAALAAGVPHLVLISTDKAVRPTSVMGASKRIAEQVVQLAARESGKAYVSVRFGNVLGSRGSVVPTFLRQIAAGGPVLVTHPEMRRYFMTIPEAVQLVLQAYVLGKGDEVFCLDMGEPVKIVDLARDLIALTATPGGPEVQVRFTGARPGEKMYEEMFFDKEHARATAHPKVLCALGTEVSPSTAAAIAAACHKLQHAPNAPDAAELRAVITMLVEDYGVESATELVPA